MIKQVHLIFKTHLDVGFTDFAANVVARYFTSYIPQALTVARQLRETDGPERFIWTTGSWLIYEYLEQAAPTERRQMETAILAGDIVWHGLPFTMHSELLDVVLFEYGLSLSQELDRHFGKQTIAAKMTDVPGHTRGIVPLLARAGIQFLHLGVNQASPIPEVPPLFVWREPKGAEIIVMYQQDYGATMTIPNLADAIAFGHTGDNLGPQSPNQIRTVFDEIRQQFPGADVTASTLDTVARAVLPIKPQLPVFDAEIGDTWIHGVGSDPKKVSQFRALCRLRKAWLDEGKVALSDKSFAAFSRTLLLIPEHTWGLDEKTHLADYTNYAAEAFHTARVQPNFKKMEASWAEQRVYLQHALNALGDSPLKAEATNSLLALEPVRPIWTDWQKITEVPAQIETPHVAVTFDTATGAIIGLHAKAAQRDWAAPDHPLGRFQYETFSQRDYDRYWEQYIVNKSETRQWAWDDFTKPGITVAQPEHKRWYPTEATLYERHDPDGICFDAELMMPAESCTKYGCPRLLVLEWFFPFSEPCIYLDLQWFDKPACRLPEALWLSFAPLTSVNGQWTLEKLGQPISPLDVVSKGNRHLHVVGSGVTYTDQRGGFLLRTLDAPLVAPGESSLLNFTNRQPSVENGMHVNLYNNIWGTNFPMWYDEDARFRFVLTLPQGLRTIMNLLDRERHIYASCELKR